MMEEFIVSEVNQIDYDKINELYARRHGYINYLNDTDYMAAREVDGGERMPDEAVENRAVARFMVGKIDEQVSALERGEDVGELATDKEVNEVRILARRNRSV